MHWQRHVGTKRASVDCNRVAYIQVSYSESEQTLQTWLMQADQGASELWWLPRPSIKQWQCASMRGLVSAHGQPSSAHGRTVRGTQVLYGGTRVLAVGTSLVWEVLCPVYKV